MLALSTSTAFADNSNNNGNNCPEGNTSNSVSETIFNTQGNFISAYISIGNIGTAIVRPSFSNPVVKGAFIGGGSAGFSIMDFSSNLPNTNFDFSFNFGF